MAGWPRRLTYLYRGKAAKRALRRQTLRLVPPFESRDEYPFASTLENEGNVWVGQASGRQQDARRDLMNAFYRAHGADAKGAMLRFEVRVVNHPKGAVRAA